MHPQNAEFAPPDDAELFAAHLAVVRTRYEAAMEACGLDMLVVDAGAPYLVQGRHFWRLASQPSLPPLHSTRAFGRMLPGATPGRSARPPAIGTGRLLAPAAESAHRRMDGLL